MRVKEYTFTLEHVIKNPKDRFENMRAGHHLTVMLDEGESFDKVKEEVRDKVYKALAEDEHRCESRMLGDTRTKESDAAADARWAQKEHPVNAQPVYNDFNPAPQAVDPLEQIGQPQRETGIPAMDPIPANSGTIDPYA